MTFVSIKTGNIKRLNTWRIITKIVEMIFIDIFCGFGTKFYIKHPRYTDGNKLCSNIFLNFLIWYELAKKRQYLGKDTRPYPRKTIHKCYVYELYLNRQCHGNIYIIVKASPLFLYVSIKNLSLIWRCQQIPVKDFKFWEMPSIKSDMGFN